MEHKEEHSSSLKQLRCTNINDKVRCDVLFLILEYISSKNKSKMKIKAPENNQAQMPLLIK